MIVALLFTSPSLMAGENEPYVVRSVTMSRFDDSSERSYISPKALARVTQKWSNNNISGGVLVLLRNARRWKELYKAAGFD